MWSSTINPIYTILDFDLVKIINGVTEYYGRHEMWPKSKYLYPNLQIGLLNVS